MGYSNCDAMENLMLTSFTIILKRVQTEDLEYIYIQKKNLPQSMTLGSFYFVREKPQGQITIITRNYPNPYTVKPVLRGHIWEQRKSALIRQMTS